MSCSTAKYNYTGKVALVTGSSSGIGAAIAIQLASYGAKVTITGRNAEALEKVAQKIREVSGGVAPLVIVGNLLEESFPAKLINETVAKFGRLDILINNAGGTVPDGKLSSPKLLEEYDHVMKLDLRVPVALTQLAVPHLEATRGNIINMSSTAAIKPWTLPYCAAKSALDMVTKCSALELGPKGIRVNSVNPGPVVSNFVSSMGIQTQAEKDAIYDYVREGSLMKYVGEVEDIANLVSFVASDDAKNVTGSSYVSDSGFLLKSAPL